MARYTLRHDIHYSDRVMVADPAGEWRTNRDYEALLTRCKDADDALRDPDGLNSRLKYLVKYPDPLEET